MAEPTLTKNAKGECFEQPPRPPKREVDLNMLAMEIEFHEGQLAKLKAKRDAFTAL